MFVEHICRAKYSGSMTTALSDSLASALKREALRLGFSACGIACAEKLDPEARRLEEWLEDGRHASMSWMERNFEKRVDPRKLVPGARSVVSVLHSYDTGSSAKKLAQSETISRYAWGDDYHDILKEKLAELFDWLDDRVGGLDGRVFVDSAPVMDKAWAQRAGLGWIGKNTNFLTREGGSFYFIGEMIVDVELTADEPFTTDHCGSCTRCVDACPTGALDEPYQIDGERCISYWTIEHRGDTFPEELARDFGTWIFGCDICQTVCPWNQKFSEPARDSRFLPRSELTNLNLEDWEELDLTAFRKLTRRSPLKRAGLEGMKRNARYAQQNRPQNSID